jgi:hypothetical protein
MPPCASLGRGLLCPFDYYGVPDEVDYANIPWRSQRKAQKKNRSRCTPVTPPAYLFSL